MAQEKEWRDLKEEFLKANRSLEVCALKNSNSESILIKSVLDGRWGRNDQIYTLHDKCYEQNCPVEYDQALEWADRFNAHPRYKDYMATYYKAFVGLGICKWYNMKKGIGWSLKYQ